MLIRSFLCLSKATQISCEVLWILFPTTEFSSKCNISQTIFHKKVGMLEFLTFLFLSIERGSGPRCWTGPWDPGCWSPSTRFFGEYNFNLNFKEIQMEDPHPKELYLLLHVQWNNIQLLGTGVLYLHSRVQCSFVFTELVPRRAPK